MKIRQSAYNLIKRSEKIFKTDMVYVAKNGIWVMIGQVVSIVSAFGLSILFANLLPMQEYGVYKYVLSFIGMISAFSLTGMHTAVIQATSRGFDKTLINTIKTTLRWNIAPLLFYILSAGYYFLNDNQTLAISIGCAGILNLIVNSFGLYGSYLAGKQNYKLATIYSIITQSINTAAIIITIFLTNNVVLLILINFLSTALFVLFFSIRTIKTINPNSTSDSSTIHFGKHLSYMNVLSAIVGHLDKILVFQKLGAVELAIFSFAIAVPEQIRGIFKNFLGIATPKYAHLNQEQLRYSIIAKVKTLTLITTIIVITYIFISPIIFKILFPKYLESIFYSQIYILGIITMPSITLFYTYFQVRHQTSIMYKVSTLRSTAGLILTIYLIHNYGLIGSSLLNTTSQIITLFICLYYFQKDKPGSEN